MADNNKLITPELEEAINVACDRVEKSKQAFADIKEIMDSLDPCQHKLILDMLMMEYIPENVPNANIRRPLLAPLRSTNGRKYC